MQSLMIHEISRCEHKGIREIGQDFDKEGNAVRLIRCRLCGLLMREDLPVESSKARL